LLGLVVGVVGLALLAAGVRQLTIRRR